MFCAYPLGEIQLTALCRPCLPPSFSTPSVGDTLGVAHTNASLRDTGSQKGEHAPRFHTALGLLAPV